MPNMQLKKPGDGNILDHELKLVLLHSLTPFSPSFLPLQEGERGGGQTAQNGY